MKFLLDTCTFIWLCADQEKIPETVRRVVDDPQHDLFLSDVSALEISLKWTKGLIRTPQSPRIWIERQISHWMLSSIKIERFDFYTLSELATLHADPFDRLLVAQAIRHNLTILTPDPHIHRYPISAQW